MSAREVSQRQSRIYGSRIQIGLPSAPARWATAVSTEITRSVAPAAAAVPAKFLRLASRSTTFPFQLLDHRAIGGAGLLLQAEDLHSWYQQAG